MHDCGSIILVLLVFVLYKATKFIQKITKRILYSL